MIVAGASGRAMGEVELRVAGPGDAASIAKNTYEGVGSFAAWAPGEWSPPVLDAWGIERLAKALQRPDVWCLMAIDGDHTVAHIALAATTLEDPVPAPAGTICLWELFVTTAWQGSGLAGRLMDEAVTEAQRRRFSRLTLWTPNGASQARRFYERAGWSPTGRRHEVSPSGLATVEYERSTEPASRGPRD